MATKQALINFYYSEYEKHAQMAQAYKEKAISSADEEFAYYFDGERRVNKLIASLCSQFVKNLKEMEG